MRKKWLILPACATLAALAVVALLVRFAAEDARQAALLDARVQDAENRFEGTLRRELRLFQDGAPAEQTRQAYRDANEACKELDRLRTEQWRRRQTWHARLRGEVKRRTGWRGASRRGASGFVVDAALTPPRPPAAAWRPAAT